MKINFKNNLNATGKIIILMFLVLVKIETLSAQHLIRECSTCKFMPKRTSPDKSSISQRGGCLEFYECPACAKKDKEEKEARRAEDKRVLEQIKQRLAEEKRKSDEEYKRKIDEANAQRKASYVTIEMPKNVSTTQTIIDPNSITSYSDQSTGKIGIKTNSGKILFKAEFDKVKWYDPNRGYDASRCVLSKDKSILIIDSKGKTLHSFQLDQKPDYIEAYPMYYSRYNGDYISCKPDIIYFISRVDNIQAGKTYLRVNKYSGYVNGVLTEEFKFAYIEGEGYDNKTGGCLHWSSYTREEIVGTPCENVVKLKDKLEELVRSGVRVKLCPENH